MCDGGSGKEPSITSPRYHSHITAKLTFLMQEFGGLVLAKLAAQVYLFEKL